MVCINTWHQVYQVRNNYNNHAHINTKRATPSTENCIIYVRWYVFLCTKQFFYFFRNAFTLLLRPHVFSRAFGCGALRRLACTPRRKCGSRPGLRSACCGRSKSLNLAENGGEAFRSARAKQVHGNHKFPIVHFVFYHCGCFSSTTAALKRLRRAAYGF